MIKNYLKVAGLEKAERIKTLKTLSIKESISTTEALQSISGEFSGRYKYRHFPIAIAEQIKRYRNNE